MTETTSTYDVAEITADNAGSLGYDPTDRGLAVQRDGEWLTWAANLDDAARVIGERVAATVTLVPDPSFNYGCRWTVTVAETAHGEAGKRYRANRNR